MHAHNSEAELAYLLLWEIERWGDLDKDVIAQISEKMENTLRDIALAGKVVKAATPDDERWGYRGNSYR